jgi:hypothetical protein
MIRFYHKMRWKAYALCMLHGFCYSYLRELADLQET